MAGDFKQVIEIAIQSVGDENVRALLKSLRDLGDSAELSDDQLSGLTEELKGLAEAKNAVDSIVKLKASLSETGSNLALAKTGLEELNKEFDNADQSSARVKRAFANAEKAVADLAAKEGALKLELEKANGVIAKHGLDSERLGDAQQELARRSGEAASRISELGKEADKGGRFTRALQAATEAGARGFAKLRDGVNSLGNALLKITGLAGAVGAALSSLSVSRFFGGAVSSATEFEAALSQVRAVSGATNEQLARMRAAAENASKTTTFSSLEAATALGELARASGDADAAISQLGPTLALAQAAGIGASESAAILTTTITQFGLAAGDATRVADLFAREANSTQDDVTSLGNAMSYAAPLARQLGVSIEDTTAILGALADQGFRGERAGTALRNVFTQMIDPASAFRTELNALGIKTNNFSEIIEQLAAQGEKSQAALLALGDRAGPAITALVTTGGAGIQRLTADFRGAAGEAERTARIMSENFSGASSRLTNAFDSLRRALVDPILDPLAKQFDSVAQKIRAFAETAQFERIKNAVRDFAVGATDAIIRFASSVDFSKVASAIEGFATSTNEFFTKIKDGASSVGTALSVVGGLISTLFNGIQTVILGAAAASTAGFAAMLKGAGLVAEGVARIYGNYELLKPVFDSVNEKIGGITAIAAEFGRRAVENGRETRDAFVGLSDALSGTGDAAASAEAAIDGVANPLKLSAENAAELRRQFEALPEHLRRIVEPGLRAQGLFDELARTTPGTASGVTSTAEALKRAESAATSAYNELARLSGAGDTSSQAFRNAQAAYVAANAALAKLRGESEATTKAAKDLAAAQERLGKTQAKLSAEAAQAATDLDLIYKSYLSGSSAIEDVRRSFDKYAAALRASVSDSDSWKQETTESMLAVKAAALGIGEIKGPEFKAGNTQPLTDGLQQVSQGAQVAAEGLAQVETQADATSQSAGGAAQAIKNIYEGFANELGKVSEAAVLRFNEVTRRIFELGSGIADFSGLARFGKAAQDAYTIVNGEIAKQRGEVAALAQSYGELTDAALQSMINSRGGVDNVAAGLAEIAEAARNGQSEFQLLGAQDLSGLASSADAVADRVRRIGEEAAESERQLADMAASFQDQIDQINGNQAAIENRRFQQDLERLEELRRATGEAQNSEYNQAVAAAERLHQLKLSQIREQEQAQRESDSRTSGGASSNAGSSPRPAGNSGSQGNGSSGGFGGVPVNINLNGQTVPVNVNNQGDLNRLIALLRQAMQGSGAGGSLIG